MQVVITLSTLRSKHMRKIPIGLVIKEPLNRYPKIEEEKKLNIALSKVASPYFRNTEPSEITVHEKHLNLSIQKEQSRISELEAKVHEINSQLGSRNPYGIV